MKTDGLILGPSVAAVVAAVLLGLGLGPGAALVGALTSLCAVWWTLEPIPIAATSLLPFVVLPMAGLLDRSQVSGAFGHPLILLLMGGFLLSTVMERSGAHEQLALRVVRAFGATRGPRAVLGFMVACALVSMWISNTATVLMLLPVAAAVVQRSSAPERLAAPLFLGLAWSANIGGMGTPVGTPPNALLLAELHAQGLPWGFAEFLRVGGPVVVLMVPMAWLWLCRGGRLAGIEVTPPVARPWSAPEVRALALFGLTIVLWVSRTAPFGGWSAALGLQQVGDHTVALAMVVLAFLLPSGDGSRLLDWPTAVRIPWGLLLLFAGGIALGSGFRTSGLDVALGDALAQLAALPLPATVFVLALVVTFATEVLSNTATAALLMPILSAAAVGAGEPAAAWLMPAGLSASCAFMLPVSTAPNAIVVGAGHVPPRVMVREGLAMNLLGAVLITATTVWLLPG